MLSQHVVPTLLRAEYQLDELAHCASATGDSADPIHPLAHFWCRVGQAADNPTRASTCRSRRSSPM